MKAIIFSAGLGTRLRPLTNNCPKALVKLNGQPLLWHAINQMIKVGVTQVVVNIHHFGDQIIEYINSSSFNIPILISDEREQLLNTGGGLLKASKLLESNTPTIAYNVDVITSLNIKDVITYHQIHHPMATMVVRKRITSRYLMFNDDMKLCGWKNETTGESKKASIEFSQSNPWAFSGIQILSPDFLRNITEKGSFSIIATYLRLAKEHKILGYPDNSDFWIDLGKPGQIEKAEKHLSQQK